MSILINKNTRLIVQGITGRDGSFHATKMKAYGTNVVGGTSPGKAGQNVEGIKLIICITEGVPTLDVVEAYRYIRDKGANLIGPNCPGLISPAESMVGIMPTNIFKKGHTGVISRSGTLTYQVVANLTENGMGQTTAVGVGGDPIVGLYFQDLLEMFENDPETDSVAIIGEIGGDAEERAAEYIRDHMTKPVVAFISGREAPKGKQMGHAGAIISSGSGTAAEKIAAFEAAGVPVARETSEIPELLAARLKK